MAEDQRQPAQRALVVELGDGQDAVVEQVAIGGRVVRRKLLRGDKAVDVLEGLVVTRIDDDAAVRGDDAGRGFVFEAAQRGALDRRRFPIVGVDLDDPAEAVRLVRILLDVEAIKAR